MRIVIDFSNRKYGLTRNEILFLDKCFQLLMNQHSEHQWITEPFAETKGVISLLPLGIKKTLLLERVKPDVFISADKLNKKTSARFRQVSFYNQEFESVQKNGNRLQSADLIITSSGALKKKLLQQNLLQEKNIVVIPAAPSEDVSLADWSEKLNIKQKYTDGREFFLAFKEIGPSSNWEELLKAFSIFKKWQQSSFKLLIVAQVDAEFVEEFEEKFNSYKYRQDVRILDPGKDDIDAILPTAFGLICAEPDHTGITLLNGFKTEVPVITSPNELFDEDISGAFLPAIYSADELSRQLINLYRDERLRETLVEKAREIQNKYSWQKSADLFYTYIRKLMNS